MNKFARATFRVAVVAVVLLAAGFCRADDAAQTQKRMENRFLFVIDSSSSMKSRTNGIEQAVAGLLSSDMHGEFRKGDTLGVWTYDDHIHADFPMQVWSPEKKDLIAADVLRFVQHQRYEKRAHLDKVLGAVGKVMAQSDRLTIILIHDGSDLIRGTEFDGDINDLQKKYSRQFRSAHLPMVTILAARFGQVFDYTINYPGSITIPHTAAPLPPPAETNTPPALAVAPPSNPVPTEPSPPPRRIEIIMSGTNSVTRTIPQTESAGGNPSSAQNDIVMVGAPQPTPAPAPPPATPAPVAAEQITSSPPPAASKPEPAPPETAAVAAQPEPAPVIPSAPPKTLSASAPTPIPAAASTPAPNTAQPPCPASSIMLPPVAPLPPVPRRWRSLHRASKLALFVIAFSLLTTAAVLVVFLVRRSRGGAPPNHFPVD